MQKLIQCLEICWVYKLVKRFWCLSILSMPRKSA